MLVKLALAMLIFQSGIGFSKENCQINGEFPVTKVLKLKEIIERVEDKGEAYEAKVSFKVLPNSVALESDPRIIRGKLKALDNSTIRISIQTKTKEPKVVSYTSRPIGDFKKFNIQNLRALDFQSNVESDMNYFLNKQILDFVLSTRSEMDKKIFARESSYKVQTYLCTPGDIDPYPVKIQVGIGIDLKSTITGVVAEDVDDFASLNSSSYNVFGFHFKFPIPPKPDQKDAIDAYPDTWNTYRNFMMSAEQCQNLVWEHRDAFELWQLATQSDSGERSEENQLSLVKLTKVLGQRIELMLNSLNETHNRHKSIESYTTEQVLDLLENFDRITKKHQGELEDILETEVSILEVIYLYKQFLNFNYVGYEPTIMKLIANQGRCSGLPVAIGIIDDTRVNAFEKREDLMQLQDLVAKRRTDLVSHYYSVIDSIRARGTTLAFERIGTSIVGIHEELSATLKLYRLGEDIHAWLSDLAIRGYAHRLDSKYVQYIRPLEILRAHSITASGLLAKLNKSKAPENMKYHYRDLVASRLDRINRKISELEKIGWRGNLERQIDLVKEMLDYKDDYPENCTSDFEGFLELSKTENITLDQYLILESRIKSMLDKCEFSA